MASAIVLDGVFFEIRVTAASSIVHIKRIGTINKCLLKGTIYMYFYRVLMRWKYKM